jgi:hypothetical protein
MSNTNRYGRPGEYNPYNSHRYKAIAKAIVRANPICARCNGPIDLDIDARARMRKLPDGSPNPDLNHPAGGTAGHIISVAELRAAGRVHEANEESNLQPEHRHCNSRHGARMLHRINRHRTYEASREW